MDGHKVQKRSYTPLREMGKNSIIKPEKNTSLRATEMVFPMFKHLYGGGLDCMAKT